MGTSGAGILQTVEHYLRSDCALASTASDLYLHVNSVRHRLRRFEEVTGCSLKSNEALAEIWWALARQRMISDRSGSVG
jgi:DNA-binding PucR family transcriptional regulator